jgi:phosphatidylglycerol---prolipoprotein diacylglyceryl transferase
MHPILLRITLPAWKLPWIGELHSIPIHSYGVMLGLSLVVGWYLTLGLAEKDGLPKETLANCYVVTAITAVLMARVFYFITNPSELKSPLEFFALWRGGLVAYGGFIGGLLGSYFFLKYHKLRLLPWADVAVPSLASGLMLTRIGCYMFGCDFGKPLPDSAPGWLKTVGTFPHWPEGTLTRGSGSPAWFQHVENNLIGADAATSLPVHPTQIYESLVGALLLALLFWVRKNQKFRGQVFLVFAFAYGVCRFVLEILRDDLERGEFGPHLAEHWVVTGGLLLFAIAYIVSIAKAVKDPTLRKLTQVISLVPAVIAFLVLRPESFIEAPLVQLSTSQWVAVLTGIPAAIAFGIFYSAAQMHPDTAMSLGLEDYRGTDLPVNAEKSAETEKAEPETKQAESEAKDASPAAETGQPSTSEDPASDKPDQKPA